MKRIQRKRVKGWRMPKNTVYVGRPTMWGNPYTVGSNGPYLSGYKMTARETVDLYESLQKSRGKAGILEDFISRLRGKDLACWCPLDKPCHADVLINLCELAELEQK